MDIQTTVLWDIDGTLVLNATSPANMYHQAVERAVGHELEQLVGHQHGRTDAGLLVEHLAAHGLDPGLLPIVSEHLQDLTDERSAAGSHRIAAAGVPELLARMTALGWRNGLLTGNSAYRARIKLEGAGYDVASFAWGHSFFGDEDVDRAAMTRRAATALRGGRTAIVGDTPRDGEAADAVGIPFVAVATGTYSADELAATSAVVVVDNCVVGADTIIDAIERLTPLG